MFPGPYFNQAGEPMTPEAWAIAFHDIELRRLALDEFSVEGERVVVSTVWVGIDMSAGFSGGPPLVFETLVSGGLLDELTVRYPTRAEALDGHAALISSARKRRSPSTPDPPDTP